MEFDNFRMSAKSFITEAYCKKCGNNLVEIPNGWFSVVMFCPKCKIIYAVKLIKVPDEKISKEFLEQAERTADRKLSKKTG